MNCRKLVLWAGLAVAIVITGPRGAAAKEEFPGRIAADLGAPEAPPCGLCHQNGKTGGDTLVTPFAWAMRARGLTGEGSLDQALARVQADRVDSDGDGITDTDEIIAGTDPNSAASSPSTPGSPGDPQLGCAVGGDDKEGARAPGAAGAALLALLAVFRALRPPRRRSLDMPR